MACGAWSRKRETITSQPSLRVNVCGWGRNPDRDFSVFIVAVGRIVRSAELSGWCTSLRFDVWVQCFPYVTEIVVGFQDGFDRLSSLGGSRDTCPTRTSCK